MIGTTVSHFKITAKLGEGGMGEVYLAEDTKLGREVAIKVLLPHLAADPSVAERFRSEVSAAASIGHRNLVDIMDEMNITFFIFAFPNLFFGMAMENVVFTLCFTVFYVFL